MQCNIVDRRPKQCRTRHRAPPGRSGPTSTPPPHFAKKSYSGHISQLELSLNRPLRPLKLQTKKRTEFTLIAGEFPASFAARGCYRCVRLFLLVPTQLTSLVLVVCGGRTIIGKVLAPFRLPLPFGPPCAAVGGFPGEWRRPSCRW